MKKLLPIKMIATGFLMFAGISEESAAFLKVGVSSTMTSNMGAAYGLGVKQTLSMCVDGLKKSSEFVKKTRGALGEIGKNCYELVSPEALGEMDRVLKELNAMIERFTLIRDSKREKLTKKKFVPVSLEGIYGGIRIALENADNVLKAMGEREEAREGAEDASYGGNGAGR
jgi:hypothetical protein